LHKHEKRWCADLKQNQNLTIVALTRLIVV
jgi:hypothetical protein